MAQNNICYGKYGKQQPVYATPAAVANSATPVRPDRPARVQVEQKRALQTVEHAGDYNIWYGKYMGENSFEKAPRASTRVLIEADAGLTRADYTGANAPLCLHFARGDCIYGKDCTYRHCAPTEEDESQVDAPHDVFGRTRHGSFRGDMGGTGTWNKECKTIYVGRICGKRSEPDMTGIVARHFGEFGQMDSCRVLKGKACAFVTYRMRCTAEFAKEAMAEQALDDDEQINVRWAFDDPNPKAQAVRLRNSAQLMLAAMEARGHLPETAATYAAELEGEEGEPDAKRRRYGEDAAPMTREEHERQIAEAEAHLQAAAEAAEAAEAYAAEEAAKQAAKQEAVSSASRLDAILCAIDGGGGGASGGERGAGTSGAGGGSGGSGDAGEDPLAAFLSSVGGGGEAAATTGGVDAAAAAAAGALDDAVELPPGVLQPRGLPPGWYEYLDPATGHPYFVSANGETTWRRPA